MLLFAAGFASLLYLGLTAQPTSTVVSLPDADGKAGVAELRTAGAQQTLATPYAIADVTGRGNVIARVEDSLAVQQRYASTLAARPAALVSYTLVFESGSSVKLAPQFKTVLDQLLAAVARYPAPEVTVIGHTDRVGSATDNDQLSVRRAETVRDKLIQSGIAASMIAIAGRGERESAVPTADGVARAENRRVKINVR
jgi:OOP family OmpA-OmpF porin